MLYCSDYGYIVMLKMDLRIQEKTYKSEKSFTKPQTEYVSLYTVCLQNINVTSYAELIMKSPKIIYPRSSESNVRL